MQRTIPPGPGRRDYAAVFLTSAATILFQITLTRVLSVVIWYHFAFLTLSMVMLGLGAPGVWFTFVRNPVRFLPWFLLGSGITVPFSVFLVVKFGTLALTHSLVLVVAFILPAFVALGGALCLLLIKASGPRISKMYGADLLGACLGGILVIPLLHTVPTPHLAAATGFLPLAALSLYRTAPGRFAPVVGILLLVPLVTGDSFEVTRSKVYDERETVPIYEKWAPMGRLTVFDQTFFYLEGHESGFSWGRGANFPRSQAVRQYWLEQDGSAGSPITEFDGDLTKVAFLNYDVTTVGHQLRPPRRVVVIGAGGGRDILSALVAGASEIDAVELNPHTIDAVSHRFRALSGDIYHAPGVRAFAGEGRSFLTHADRRYDLIQISLTDSWAASVAGTYALAENNLYTLEAFQLYLDRLAGEGLISVSRWMKEMPWLLVLARESLAAQGITEPQRHLAVVSADRLGTLLLSPRPFTPLQLERLEEIARTRGFTVVYPTGSTRDPADLLIAQTAEQGLEPLAGLGIRTTPPRDDSPYFFHVLSPFTGSRTQYREVEKAMGISLTPEPILALRQAVLAVVIFALLVFLILPRWVVDRSPEGSIRSLFRGSLFFASIGAGFMLAENLLIQRFVLYLGHPSTAVTVIITALVMGMGTGSLLANRFGIDRLRRWGASLPITLLLLTLVLPVFFGATLGLPLALRVALTAVLLVPLGLGMGLFFPLGMLRFGDDRKPWFWAMNGFFGVAAGVLSLALSMEFGFRSVGLVGAGLYFLAWISLQGGETGTA